MTELRFHRELYPGERVDEAVKVYAGLASLELSEEPQAWVVRVAAEPAAREKKIAGELANYALGLTVRGRSKRA